MRLTISTTKNYTEFHQVYLKVCALQERNVELTKNLIYEHKWKD